MAVGSFRERVAASDREFVLYVLNLVMIGMGVDIQNRSGVVFLLNDFSATAFTTP